jgi:hypothetical protein
MLQENNVEWKTWSISFSWLKCTSFQIDFLDQDQADWSNSEEN